LAEKRKSLVDELAIKYQQESNEHREQMKTATRQHDSEVEQLTKQIDELTVSTSQTLAACLHVRNTLWAIKSATLFWTITPMWTFTVLMQCKQE